MIDGWIDTLELPLVHYWDEGLTQDHPNSHKNLNCLMWMIIIEYYTCLVSFEMCQC